MTQAREIIIKMSAVCRGNWDEIYENIQKRTELPYHIDESVLTDMDIHSAITILDEEYPEALKRIKKPAFVLYAKGDETLLKADHDKMLAVIGSRDVALEQTEKVIDKIFSELPKDMIIVSGLARGVDAIAHKTALKYGLKTIAVIASGLGDIYPAINIGLADEIVKAGGLLVTEYPEKVRPEPEHFPARNRIVAGLAKSILVPELKQHSGTMITVTLALANGSDIYVVPTGVNEETRLLYNNRLIAEGANVAETAADIVDNLNL